MNIKPIGDRVVLKNAEVIEKTASGILLTGAAKEKPQFAEVIAVGSGMMNGKQVHMEVKVGDKVIYSKNAGTEVKLNDEEYIVLKQEDIVGIIED